MDSLNAYTVIILALQDRLRYLKSLGVPDSDALVTETRHVLDRTMTRKLDYWKVNDEY